MHTSNAKWIQQAVFIYYMCIYEVVNLRWNTNQGWAGRRVKGVSAHNHSTYTCNQRKHYNEKYEAQKMFPIHFNSKWRRWKFADLWVGNW